MLRLVLSCAWLPIAALITVLLVWGLPTLADKLLFRRWKQEMIQAARHCRGSDDPETMT